MQTDPKAPRITPNVLWQFSHQLMSILNVVFVGAMVTRHLGPADSGLLANALAVIAMLAPLITFNSDHTFMRDYVRNVSTRKQLFWTTFLWRIFVSTNIMLVFFTSMSFGIIPVVSSSEATVLALVFLATLAHAGNTAKLVLEAELRSKYSVCVLNISIISFGIVKLIAVVANCTVITFAAITSCELIANSAAVFTAAKVLGLIPRPVSPGVTWFRRMVQENVLLAVSGLFVALYVNIDLPLLRYLADATEVGLYANAAKMSTVWYFVPVVIATSLMPKLTKLHMENSAAYFDALRDYFKFVAAASIVCLCVAMITFPILIPLLLGQAFAKSVSIFYIHILSLPAVFLGVARGSHLNLERRYGFILYATAIGVLSNVILNILLIPPFRSYGAAAATLISYWLSSVVIGVGWREIRPTVQLQVLSLCAAPSYILRHAFSIRASIRRLAQF